MIPEPPDFNPHVHPRPPRTRVELLAWTHRKSPRYLVRVNASTILANAGLILAPKVSRPFRRMIIAKHAVRLRRELRATPDASAATGATQNKGQADAEAEAELSRIDFATRKKTPISTKRAIQPKTTITAKRAITGKTPTKNKRAMPAKIPTMLKRANLLKTPRVGKRARDAKTPKVHKRAIGVKTPTPKKRATLQKKPE